MFYRKRISKCCSPKPESIPTPTNMYVNLKATRTRTTSPASSSNPVQEDKLYHVLQSRNETDHLYRAIEETSTSTSENAKQTEYQALKRPTSEPDHTYGKIEAQTDVCSELKSTSAVDVTADESYEIPDVQNASELLDSASGQQNISQAENNDESYEMPELHI